MYTQNVRSAECEDMLPIPVSIAVYLASHYIKTDLRSAGTSDHLQYLSLVVLLVAAHHVQLGRLDDHQVRRKVDAHRQRTRRNYTTPHGSRRTKQNWQGAGPGRIEGGHLQ